jgi:hypothetical protein
LQVRYTGGIVDQDLWMLYDSLNTAAHREHLGFGNRTVVRLGPVSFPLMAYVDHYGGQLHAPPDDPVRDNITAAGAVACSLSIDRNLSAAGAEVLGLASVTSRDRNSDPYRRGWGVLSQVWIEVYRFRIAAQLFKGNRYKTWKGNPLYLVNGYYYCLEISRPVALPFGSTLDWGLRFDFLDIPPAEYFDKMEHQLWVSLSSALDRPLR